MLLATQCPHCHTTFRVAHDQLKLRAGLVRCGACKEIFNGIEHLLAPPEPLPAIETAPQVPATPALPPYQYRKPEIAHSGEPDVADVSEDEPKGAFSDPAPSEIAVEAGQDEESEAIDHQAAERAAALAASLDFEGVPEPPPVEPRHVPAMPVEEEPIDPLTRMTLMDFSEIDDVEESESIAESESDRPDHAPEPGAEEHTGRAATLDSATEEPADIPDELDHAIEDLRRMPLRGSKQPMHGATPDDADDIDFEEPGFMKHGRRQQRVGRAYRIALSLGSLLLLLELITQATYAYRDRIAASFPDTKPYLVQTCALIGCKIDLPTQIDTVSIESNELQTVVANKNLFVLTTLLRNHSTTVQAWPNIELTLNDANDKPLARRVFTPRDYLSSTQDVTKGFAPASEQSVKLFIQLSQLKAAGYRVYLFYS